VNLPRELSRRFRVTILIEVFHGLNIAQASHLQPSLNLFIGGGR
jgi:hypothetical protein